MQFTSCIKLPSTFTLLQLTGDWKHDDMAIVTNKKKKKVLSPEGKVKVMQQIGNEKKKTDRCWEFGLVNSMIQKIWKINTKIISAFEQNG